MKDEMIEFIKKLDFEERTMTFWNRLSIEINENKNVLNYVDSEKNIRNTEIENNALEKYFEILFRVIDDWKEEYRMDGVLDGTKWSLIIEFKDGRTKKYVGINDSPLNFDYLEKINKKLIE